MQFKPRRTFHRHTAAHLLPKDMQAQRQTLSFTTTSLRNVVISNTSDVIFYEVVTPSWEPHLTKISRLDPNSREFNVIGELQWQSTEVDDVEGRRDGGKGKGKGKDNDNDKRRAEKGRKRLKENGARPVRMRLYGGAFKPTREFLRQQGGSQGSDTTVYL